MLNLSPWPVSMPQLSHRNAGITGDAFRPARPEPSGKTVLLHAERCLTLFSELPGPWSEWLPPSAHNCLVGCLICQKVCPKNKGLLSFESIEVSFDAEETAMILAENRNKTDPLWDRIKTKLDSMGLSGYKPVVGRNLKALTSGS